MKKLLALFKSLPREVRMLIAMAGLGTPLGAMYVLKRFLFPGWSMFMVILVVAGTVGVICLVGFVIAKIFGRGAKKRQRKMAADLADEGAGGPTGMDVRASIKANNEKFFTAIKDMNKNLGLSVYDLPWYIVLGDSGCGKTKLINEGGLTFSTGKPEGYQLGTLNYNWWFTEDAVFVDMAGRLCNPQDDADRKEWEAFLNTVGRGRKGYPVNGALVCVSADHLLEDSPEKVEQDANTMLERLRDLQAKLGVTFATYLLVTKCDKILGFMQFFDRAERDITFKNQIFGWSKEGNYNELYDPEMFGGEFGDLYSRLNELRLRRLNDEADEIDLGLAYSYPEEFRELKAPLQTYIRTLFPMIRNPRAIKNLLFRGIYFTSATQEGALILKHLSERLGSDVGSQFAPLDLYPNKRPHFIKDLLFRKVFPEHGLVFRNEEQAMRKRKMAKVLKWSSAALFVLLVTLLGLSSYKFGSMIGQPRTDASGARPDIERTSADALLAASALGDDVNILETNRAWARILSLGIGSSKPIIDLNAIRAGMFERELLSEALSYVEQALKTTMLQDPRAGEEARRAANEYMASLEQYVGWFGCAREGKVPKGMDLGQFEILCRVVTDKEAIMVTKKEQFFSQAAAYFTVLARVEDRKNPAGLLLGSSFDPAGTIRAALLKTHSYLAGYAELNDTHPDPLVREWLRIRTRCDALETSYTSMLDAAREDPETLEDLQTFRETFVKDYQTFADSVQACRWQGSSEGVHTRIDPLGTAILAQRKLWTDYQASLLAAYSHCEASPDEAVGKALAALAGGSDASGLPGLDRTLWASLRQVELTDREYKEAYYDAFAQVVKEVPARYPHIFALTSGGGTASDALQTSPDLSEVGGILKNIHDGLVAAKLDVADDVGTPADWVDELEELLGAEDSDSQIDVASLPPVWRPDELSELHEAHLDLIILGQGRRLLNTMLAGLDQTGRWGLAELVPDWNSRMPSVYRIDVPRGDDDQDSERQASKPDRSKKNRSKRTRRGRRGQGERRRETRKTTVVKSDSIGQVPACATRPFLNELMEESSNLLYSLGDFDSSYYFRSTDDTQPLNEVCMQELGRAGRVYTREYVRSWADAYESADLSELGRLIDRADDWDTLARMMQRGSGVRGTGGDAVANELQVALTELLEAVPFWSWYLDNVSGRWTSNVDPTDMDWLEVASWMQDAIEKDGGQALASFAVEAQYPKDSLEGANDADAPWSALADGFVERWTALSKAIASNVKLPNKFGNDARKEDTAAIPWNTIQALREEARIDKEYKLTGQLVAFESKAQELLSRALSETLFVMQSRYFANADAYDGWPYLNESAVGPKSLQTVDFVEFKEFVREVGRAQLVFQPIEESLPHDEPFWMARNNFYEGARNWVGFMGLGNRVTAEALVVSVEGADPVTEPFGKERVHDTAQQYYDAVSLDLALAVVKDDEPGSDVGRPLRIATLTEKKINRPQNAVWDWSTRAGKTELSVSLIEGRKREGSGRSYPNLTRTFGETSPLALCAYLHRHGIRYGDKWVTSHSFDLPARFRAAGQAPLISTLDPDKHIVGEKFLFKLERPMPDPIYPLERP